MARILIVDEKDSNSWLALKLQSEGHEIGEADDVDTALKQVEQGEWDLVILEPIMPTKLPDQFVLDRNEEFDGFRVLRELNSRNVATILWTALGPSAKLPADVATMELTRFEKPGEVSKLYQAIVQTIADQTKERVS